MYMVHFIHQNPFAHHHRGKGKNIFYLALALHHLHNYMGSLAAAKGQKVTLPKDEGDAVPLGLPLPLYP